MKNKFYQLGGDHLVAQTNSTYKGKEKRIRNLFQVQCPICEEYPCTCEE